MQCFVSGALHNVDGLRQALQQQPDAAQNGFLKVIFWRPALSHDGDAEAHRLDRTMPAKKKPTEEAKPLLGR